MSDFNDIQALLEKYWEGETTLKEERELKTYFASGNIHVQLQQYAPLFQAFREEQTVQLNKAKVVAIRPQMYWAAAASIAILLAAGAWWLFSTPENTTIIADNPKIETPREIQKIAPEPEKEVIAQAEPKRQKQSVRVKNVIKINEKPHQPNAEEVAAMAEIKAALALVSSKIRRGKHEAAKGATHLESVDKIFKRKEG